MGVSQLHGQRRPVLLAHTKPRATATPVRQPNPLTSGPRRNPKKLVIMAAVFLFIYIPTFADVKF